MKINMKFFKKNNNIRTPFTPPTPKLPPWRFSSLCSISHINILTHRFLSLLYYPSLRSFLTADSSRGTPLWRCCHPGGSRACTCCGARCCIFLLEVVVVVIVLRNSRGVVPRCASRQGCLESSTPVLVAGSCASFEWGATWGVASEAVARAFA